MASDEATIRKYTCIVKVSPDHFIKYRNVGNLLRFAAFLDAKFPEWKYCNVYSKKSKKQIGNFTYKDRPKQMYIT